MGRNIVIEDAICTAAMYADRLDTLLGDFYTRWFDTLEPSDELLHDVRCRYIIMSTQVESMRDAMRMCLTYLQAVAGGADGAVKGFLLEAQELEEIIKAKREG